LCIVGLSPTIVSTDTRSSIDSRSRAFSCSSRRCSSALDQVAQFVGVDGLRDVVEGALLQRAHGRFHRRERGDHDDGDVRVDAMDVFLQLHAVHAGHLDVEQRHVDALVLQRPQRFGRVAHGADLVPVLAEPVQERIAHGELVVDDENASGWRSHGWISPETGGGRLGSRRWNVVPRPGAVSTSKCRPPCRWTMP
jgi:hypothetical protein